MHATELLGHLRAQEVKLSDVLGAMGAEVAVLGGSAPVLCDASVLLHSF